MVTDLISIPNMEFLISASLDARVVIWDTIQSTPKRIYTEHQKGVNSLSFNEEYKLLFSAGFEHEISIWNPYIDNLVFQLEAH